MKKASQKLIYILRHKEGSAIKVRFQEPFLFPCIEGLYTNQYAVTIMSNFTREQLGSRDSEDGKRAVELLEKLAEAGRKMTPADYRAQRKSYALGAAKTPEDRERLAKRWDLRHGV